MLQGFFQLVSRFVDIAQVVPGVPKNGVQADCLFAVQEGLLVVAL